MVLTTQGKIAQYYYGIDYPPKDLRLALVDASRERIGTLVDQILLYCFHYDPATGHYTLAILRVLQLAAAITILVVAGTIMLALRRERRPP